MRRSTLKSSTAQILGVGMHSGLESWIRIHPCPNDDIGQGIVFRCAQDDQSAGVSPEMVSSTARCTSVQIGSHVLNTVEHLMSALSGLGITDAIVEFDGDEVPILDGSAAEFVLAVKRSGWSETDIELEAFRPSRSIKISGMDGCTLVAVPSDHFSISVLIEYPERSEIGSQAAFYSGSNYSQTIAPARTYGFVSELDALHARGLASGASIHNCVALLDDGSVDSRTPLRFENELARHKLLDVIGDLALTKLDIHAHIVAVRPSHTVNCELARKMVNMFNATQS